MRTEMKQVSDDRKFTVAAEDGMYLGFCGVAHSGNRLVCCYLRTDQHHRTTTDIMVAFSHDGGKTWEDHRSIAHLDVERDGAVWVVPEISGMPDGRLVIICDKGIREADTPFPYLTTWQLENKMSNHLFWSYDGGVTWEGPHQIDDVGGEPERISALSDGTCIYTRTEARWKEERYHFNAAVYNDFQNKRLYDDFPGTKMYYSNVAVFSDDGGRTWNRQTQLADDPFYSDAEVGIVETAPGRLLATTRCCDCVTFFGQPSKLIRSNDYGKTWDKGSLAPFYGHRVIPGMLASGKAMVVYRNCFGTPATYAFVFDPDEPLSYEPASYIQDESRCTLDGGVMTLRTAEGSEGAVEFALYPAENDRSRVEVAAELRVEEADRNGCCISAGCRVSFEPGRIYLADRPEDGFAFDTTGWHTYRVVREDDRIRVYADGELKLDASTDGISTRAVRFGNNHNRGSFGFRKYLHNRSVSHWRSVQATINNKEDFAVRWEWNAGQGYPDQFRRDRFVLLDKGSLFIGDNGYGGWTQLEDGSIVIVDYTVAGGSAKPYIRSYVVREQDLI